MAARGRRDHAEAAEEAAEIEASSRREDKANSNNEQEGAGDRMGEDTPAESTFDIRRDVAEIAKVPAKMIDDHRQDGDAARRIDERQARCALGRDGRIETHLKPARSECPIRVPARAARTRLTRLHACTGATHRVAMMRPQFAILAAKPLRGRACNGRSDT